MVKMACTKLNVQSQNNEHGIVLPCAPHTAKHGTQKVLPAAHMQANVIVQLRIVLDTLDTMHALRNKTYSIT